MKQSKSRAHLAGVAPIEVLVIITIIAVLVGLLLPAVQNAREGTSRLGEHPRLAFLGHEIRHFNDETERSAKTFILSLGTDPTGANSSDAVEVSLKPLGFFCHADAKLIGLRNQVDEILEDRDLTEGERRLLTETKSALDEELRGTQKLGELLRSKPGPCTSSLPTQ